MPVVPRAESHSGIAGSDDQHHAFRRSGRAIPGFGVAAAIFLHRVPRAPARRAAAGRQRLRRHRYAVDQGAAGRAAMTATATTEGRQPTEGPQPTPWRRALAFALAIWDVLRRPSSVF